MGLISFLYDPELPTKEEVSDAIVKAIAADVRSDSDPEICCGVVRGLLTVWMALDEAEDEETPTVDASEVCGLYLRIWGTAYERQLGKLLQRPDYQISDDTPWVPDSIPTDRHWPRPLLRKVASFVAHIEAESDYAMMKWAAERHLAATEAQS